MLHKKKWTKWNIKKVQAISTKGLRKDFTNKFSILNGTKYFSSGVFQKI